MSSGKCPRCGGKSVGGTSGSRCRACLKKLAAKRKTPGNKERGWKVANDAHRREIGSTAKAKKKTSGRGSTKALARKIMSAEKKTGQKLSPDRKKLGKGYANDNVRMIPIPLNRGRHHADTAKINKWRKTLKKSMDVLGITPDQMEALMYAYASEHPEYMPLKKAMDSVLKEGFLKKVIESKE